LGTTQSRSSWSKFFMSHNNPLNYLLKYGKTVKFGNFRSNVSFGWKSAFNRVKLSWKLLDQKLEVLWVRSDQFFELLCTGEQWEKFKRLSLASQTGKGWWTRRTGTPGTGDEKINSQNLRRQLNDKCSMQFA
jgi:hypothetical protein